MWDISIFSKKTVRSIDFGTLKKVISKVKLKKIIAFRRAFK